MSGLLSLLLLARAAPAVAHAAPAMSSSTNASHAPLLRSVAQPQ